MASCLGLYVENNLIKYAKVSKEKDGLKIDSFGIKFYSNIDEAIDQIVQETNSTKTLINVNLINEDYQYFSMFAQLNKKDLEKAIKMEFESYCAEKGYNANTIETRYLCADDTDNPERIKVINISENVVELNKVKEPFDGKKIGMILPLPISITNIAELNGKENVMIINLEEKTTITTIKGKYISDVITIDDGSGEILNKIAQKENSYAKAYDAIRNTTIYTSETVENYEADNEQAKYLEDILPVIYNIISNVQVKMNESVEKIDRIYLTGTLSSINNIDLYFQEYLANVRCEILRPTAISVNRDTNIKEYIEVNSAIALALHGLGLGIEGVSFKQDITKMDVKDLFKIKDIKIKKKEKNKDFFKFDAKVTKTETWLVRLSISFIIFIFAYITFSKILIGQIQEKKTETENVITSIKSEISKMDSDTKKLNNKATEYTTLIDQLNTINEKISEVTENKYLIPNLLTQIARCIDQNVQIVSISNPYDKHIIIEAKSPQYGGLGFFKTSLSINNILTNVVAGGGIKQGDEITVTIEGDLP